jgi:hypothetical protein
MKKIRIGKLVRATAWGIGSIATLLIMLHLALPYIINLDSVRNGIVETVSAALPGRIHFASLKPALLPAPHVAIDRGGYSEPGKIRLQFNSGRLRLRFWPLIAGRLALDTLEIDRPDIALFLPSSGSASHRSGPALTHEVVKAHISSFLSGAADLTGHGRIIIAKGRLTISRGDRIHLQLQDVDVQAAGFDQVLQIDLNGTSALVRHMDLRCRIDVTSLDASADIHAKGLTAKQFRSLLGLSPSPWFPDTVVDIDAAVEVRELNALESRFYMQTRVLTIGSARRSSTIQNMTIDGTARWTTDQLQVHINRLQSTSPGFDLSATLTQPATPAPITLSVAGSITNLTAVRNTLLKLSGKIPVLKTICDIVQGGSIPFVKVLHSAPTLQALTDMEALNVEAHFSNGRIQVPPELFLLDKVRGKVIWTKGRLHGEAISARLGNSTARSGTLTLGLADGSKAFALDTNLSADLTQLQPILKKLVSDPSRSNLLKRSHPLSGRAEGRLILGDRLDRIRATVVAQGKVRLLDAKGNLRVHLTDIPAPSTRIKISGKGDLGPQSLHWLGQWGNIPNDYIPGSKLILRRVEATRDPNGRIDIRTKITAADDVAISCVLQIETPSFNLARLHIRDTVSDANISLKRPDSSAPWRLVFNGILDKATLDNLFQQDWISSGRLKGRLRATVHPQQPAHSLLQGSLAASDIRFQTPAMGSVHIPEAALTVADNLLNIPKAVVQWQDHTFQISGAATVSPEALDLNLALAANALNVDELIQVIEKRRSTSTAGPVIRLSWPKPQGLVSVDIDDLVLGGYRFKPLHADISLDTDRTLVDVTTADVCGISVPGRIEITREKAVLKFKPRAKNRVLTHTGSCLTSAANTERYEGTIDVNGDLSTQGAGRDDLIANLRGVAEIRITDGRVYNIGAAGLLTNILSYLSIHQLLKGGAPDLTKNDFRYNSIETKLSLKKGLLQLEEGVLKSNAINLVAEGNYDVTADDLKLNVLVSPLTTLDWVIERIPIINRILKGTLVAVPVQVKGPVADPEVVPLSIEAMGSRVGGILKRALETPFKIIEPILPEASDTAAEPDGKEMNAK